MKEFRTMLITLLILLWCIFPAQAEEPEGVSSPVCDSEPCELTIYAYTLDGSRRVPLPGASFTLRGSDDTVLAHMTTGETGIVTLSPLPMGTYRLEQTDAPVGYRTLSQPLELQLLAGGTVLLDNTVIPAVRILHRRMPWSSILWLMLPASLLPAMVRLALLYQQQSSHTFINFSSLVHLSQSFSSIGRILNIRKENSTSDGVI